MRPPTSPNQSSERVADRLRAMFGMYEVGVDMLRCRLKREQPDATPQQISQQIGAVLYADRHDETVYTKRTCSRFSEKS